jgi:hypothetical protein
MKWMLFVLVFGSHPVETNLLFDNLDACLRAEETMRTEYARAYSQGTWGYNCGRVKRSLRGQQVWSKDHGHLHSACVRLLRIVGWCAKPGVEFTNGKRPGCD